MTVKCPICKKDVSRENPEFPFCSERCRILDLGNWASEKYVISTPADAIENVEDIVGDVDPDAPPPKPH